uniref:Haloacetate dehalogenase n=1 Tax=Candidatus Kentrum sp. TC TaxID=2126339 RepID=A0A450ZAQ5_9GAMM|nr:MAG: haloacetate dehalogenase [Candidatus Kentron sp. TC]VFK50853.1 MAG: haloacetate dehalogenase [Candidatus Kentron sp. TC]VFK64041.1 MAG: haloacetate dehalogenase [Candidatus Kentron sp. TC]
MFGDDFHAARIRTSGAEIHFVHGGFGPALLLLHGYPQTHLIWRDVAPRLARDFHVICPDLRGYGDSSKPPTTPDHSPYSKRAMARDMVEVMASLGYSAFFVAGHDRGARVAHRMALDYPERIGRACVMDIAPTHHMFKTTDQRFATAYYHWFFLIQPDGLPEHLIGADPAYYLTERLKRGSAPGAVFADASVAEYIRCFSEPETIHASCEDYRAAASIDLEHDEEDRHKRVTCPLLILWGSKGFVGRAYDVLEVWRERAEQVEGRALDCGHFLPEEASTAVYGELLRFLG